MTGLYAKASGLKISISKADVQYIVGHSKFNTVKEVLIWIKDILEETLQNTLIDLEMWIDRFVPKRTGHLRHDLKQQLKSSNVKKNVLRFILQTQLDYASKVNEMSTYQVRHLGPKENDGSWAYANYWGHSGRITLDDPEAKGNFFDKFLKFARDRVIINLAKAKTRAESASNLNSIHLRRLGING